MKNVWFTPGSVRVSRLNLYDNDGTLFVQEIPFQPGAQLARRAGQYLCVADSQFYNVIDLHTAQMFPVLPVNQASDDTMPVKPFIVFVGGNEFLLLSWTGASTLGVFITGEGDPVRGTLEWPSHPLSVCEWCYTTYFSRCKLTDAGRSGLPKHYDTVTRRHD